MAARYTKISKKENNKEPYKAASSKAAENLFSLCIPRNIDDVTAQPLDETNSRDQTRMW